MSNFRIYPCIFRAGLRILSGEPVPFIDATIKHNRLTPMNAPDICRKYGEYDFDEECIGLSSTEQVIAVVKELRDAGFEPEIVEGDDPAPDLSGEEKEITRRIHALGLFWGFHNFHPYQLPFRFNWELEAIFTNYRQWGWLWSEEDIDRDARRRGLRGGEGDLCYDVTDIPTGFKDAFLRMARVRQQEVIEEEDNVCPMCGSDKYVLFDDGTAKCFDCSPADEEITGEEVAEIVADLEAKGLVEWTGEYRPDPDGTLEKVYRATEKRLLH